MCHEWWQDPTDGPRGGPRSRALRQTIRRREDPGLDPEISNQRYTARSLRIALYFRDKARTFPQYRYRVARRNVLVAGSASEVPTDLLSPRATRKRSTCPVNEWVPTFIGGDKVCTRMVSFGASI
jgi:hypothetical protein